jgi:eukaryotic-like serine/threonine-protein kinase
VREKAVNGENAAMARPRRAREEVVEGAAPPIRPPWYRDVWHWLLVLLLVVLAGVGGYVAWQVWGDDANGDTRVPRAIGLDQSEAITRVQDAGFRVGIKRIAADHPEGRVAHQSPLPGAMLDKGETVTLSVSSGPTAVTDTTVITQTETVEVEPRTVEVPDVVGQNQIAAGAAIEGQGLAADSYPVSGEDERGIVVSQTPGAGSELEEGEIVRLDVSQGVGRQPTRTVPDAIGAKASAARELLRKSGFTVRTRERDAPSDEEVGEVLAQQPRAGVHAEDLSQVTIFVGN